MVSERASAHPTPPLGGWTTASHRSGCGLAALWLSRSRREVDVGSRIRLKVLRCALRQQQTTKMRWRAAGKSPKSWSPVSTYSEHQWKFYYLWNRRKIGASERICCCSTRLLECARVNDAGPQLLGLGHAVAQPQPVHLLRAPGHAAPHQPSQSGLPPSRPICPARLQTQNAARQNHLVRLEAAQEERRRRRLQLR
jgi:hypothetical protein